MAKLTLKAARVNIGMTQSELAEKMGVSLNSVSNWETGDTLPNAEKLQRLLEILGIKFEDINFLP